VAFTGGWADPVADAEVVQAYRANASFDAHKDYPELGAVSSGARPVVSARFMRRLRSAFR
jgi:hypothetical protein